LSLMSQSSSMANTSGSHVLPRHSLSRSSSQGQIQRRKSLLFDSDGALAAASDLACKLTAMDHYRGSEGRNSDSAVNSTVFLQPSFNRRSPIPSHLIEASGSVVAKLPSQLDKDAVAVASRPPSRSTGMSFPLCTREPAVLFAGSGTVAGRRESSALIIRHDLLLKLLAQPSDPVSC